MTPSQSQFLGSVALLARQAPALPPEAGSALTGALLLMTAAYVADLQVLNGEARAAADQAVATHGRSTWWCPTPCGGSETPRATRPEAVAGLVAWAGRVAAKKRQRVSLEVL